MSERFELVKSYLAEIGIPITSEVTAEEIVIAHDEERGIVGMILDCEESILIIEQPILLVPADPGDLFKRLLQMNRTLVHGAFVLNEEGSTVLFRDTLELANLDRNELEGSIQALSLALAEHADELVKFARQGSSS